MKILILTIALLAIGCSNPASQTNHAVTKPTQRELQLNIPRSNWVSIFFQMIDERAKLSNLKSLRAGSLPNDDIEVRVWHGFGITPLEGFVLKRASDQWSAMHLSGITGEVTAQASEKQLSSPKSGWTVCWKRLEEAGLLTLPDAYALDCNTHMFDGRSYVVEFNRDGVYRTYLYDNPDYAKCNEAKRIIEIGKIISEEFGLKRMATFELGAKPNTRLERTRR